MSIAISTVQEIVERSVFHRIADNIINEGYYPNFRDTNLYPDTNVGQQALKAAVDAVIADKGYAVQIFGVGSSQEKGAIKVPRIVILQGQFIPGQVGYDTTPQYIDAGADYTISQRHPTSHEYYFTIHAVTKTAAQTRLLNALITMSLPQLGYIPVYNDASTKFFIEHNTAVHSIDADNGTTIIVWSYMIPDIRLVQDNITLNAIQKITEIRTNLFINDWVDLGDTSESENQNLTIDNS